MHVIKKFVLIGISDVVATKLSVKCRDCVLKSYLKLLSSYCTRDVEAAIFQLLLLPPLDDKICFNLFLENKFLRKKIFLKKKFSLLLPKSPGT